MKKKGLELLKAISNYYPLLARIIEDKTFPPLFTKFLSLYEVGEDFLFTDKILFDPPNNKYCWLYSVSMYDHIEMEGEEYHAVIDHVFSYHILLEELEKYEKKVENWNKLGFVQIGIMFWGDVLLLGMDDNNRDEIWRYGNGLIKTTISKLEDDIFIFFSKLKINIAKEDLIDLKISTSQLYQNYGEDFWRIRRTQTS